MALIDTPNLTDHDGFYADLLAAHKGLSDAESAGPAALEDVFTHVYAEQPWHLGEQQAECLEGPRAKREEDE